MTILFGRNIELIVDRPVQGVEVESVEQEQAAGVEFEAFSRITVKDLEIVFNVESDRSQGPDTLVADIYGTSEDTRYRLRKSVDTKVELRFGYRPDEMFTLFKGDLRSSIVVPENRIPVVHIEAGAGERARFNWFSRSYGKNTRIMKVVNDIVAAMGVDRGNVADVENIIETNGMPQEIKHGLTFSAHAVDAFSKILDSRGIEWSIQQDKIQVLRRGAAVQDTVGIPLLTPTAGLLGTPSIDNQGLMTVDCLIQELIYPGRLIDIESKFLGDRKNENTSRTRFKVTKATFIGSLFGDAKIKLEGRKARV